MTGERLVKLEGIGFLWSPFENQGVVRYQEMKIIFAKHGHCNVPTRRGQLGTLVVINECSINC